MKLDYEKLVGDAFDYIVANNQTGVTMWEIARKLKVSHRSATEVVHRLRDIFHTRDCNLVCNRPLVGCGPHTYRFAGAPIEALEWMGSHLQGTLSEIKTAWHIQQSMVEATDENTLEGQAARMLERLLHRVVDEMMAAPKLAALQPALPLQATPNGGGTIP